MSCREFLTKDTDNDAGIAIVVQLVDENPDIGGGYPRLMLLRSACKEPGAADKTLVAVSK